MAKDIEGGVILPAHLQDDVERIIKEKSVIRKLSRTIPMTSEARPSRMDLIEPSAVPLPADPDALIEALSKAQFHEEKDNQDALLDIE